MAGKKKIIIDSSNIDANVSLSNTFKSDQFRSDINKKWNLKSVSAGAYGLKSKYTTSKESKMILKDKDGTQIGFLEFKDPVEITPKAESEAGYSRKEKIRFTLQPKLQKPEDGFDDENIRKHFVASPLGKKHFAMVVGAQNFKDRVSINSKKKDGGTSGPSSFMDNVVKVGKRENLVSGYLQGTDPGQKMIFVERAFYDHFFEMETPLSSEQSQGHNLSNNLHFMSVKPRFNFNHKEYVNLTFEKSKFLLPEKILPNFYQLAHDYVNNDKKYRKATTLTKLLPRRVVPFYGINNNEKKKFINKYEYFDEFRKKYIKSIDKKLASLPSLQGVAKKSTNIVITSKNQEYLTVHSKLAENFPICTKIDFTTDSDVSFVNFLAETSMEEPLLKTIIAAQNSAPASRRDVTNPTSVLDTKYFTPVTFAVSSYLERPMSKTLNVLDFTKWLEDYKNIGDGVFQNGVDDNQNVATTISFIGDEKGCLQSDKKGARGQFLKTFLSMVVQGKLNSVFKNKLRSYQEMLQGKPCYTETLFYRIAKHDVDSKGGVRINPTQNFYISNFSNSSLVSFFDTQVKFDKRYKYLVYAYKLVVGNKYKYTNLKVRTKIGNSEGDSNSYRFVADVINSPSIKIIETPYFGQDTDQDSNVLIYDDPPIPPEVDIVSYKDINNKILINLDAAIGYNVDYEMPLTENDTQKFNKVREFQKLKNLKQKITFRNDDLPEKYQIFRIGPDPMTGITKKPISYKDFADSLRKEMTGPKGSFIDNIKPGRKYYYVFRAIDSRGNVSNPSPLYEVELVGDKQNSLAFPVIKVVDFDKYYDKKPIKEMRRYLYIKPSYDQVQATMQDDLKSARKAKPVLGAGEEDPLFSPSENKGKKFKIRLTSKKSGKKMDLNVIFRHVHDNLSS
jgi:hypothetical protein